MSMDPKTLNRLHEITVDVLGNVAVVMGLERFTAIPADEMQEQWVKEFEQVYLDASNASRRIAAVTYQKEFDQLLEVAGPEWKHAFHRCAELCDETDHNLGESLPLDSDPIERQVKDTHTEVCKWSLKMRPSERADELLRAFAKLRRTSF